MDICGMSLESFNTKSFPRKMKSTSILKNDARKYQIESQVLLGINEKMGGNGMLELTRNPNFVMAVFGILMTATMFGWFLDDS